MKRHFFATILVGIWILLTIVLLVQHLHLPNDSQNRQYAQIIVISCVGIILTLALWFSIAAIAWWRLELEITPGVKFRHSEALYWWRLRNFAIRFSEIRFATCALALMITAYLFSIGIEFTAVLVGYISSWNCIDNNDLKFNIVNLIHNEGIAITFVIGWLTAYTFLNTTVLRSQRETEVESLEEVFLRITKKFQELEERKKFGLPDPIGLFYYVFDYTIATGHYSAPEEFERYAKSLRHFLHTHNVDFRGLVYEYEKAKDYYEALSQDCEDMGANHTWKSDPEYCVYDGNDLFFRYLNEYNTPDTQYVKTSLFYKAQMPEDKQILRDFYKSIPKNTGKFEWNVSDLLDNPVKSMVLTCKEIGLTRFIVTNSFVISFIASKANGQGNAPAGYYSEDIITIKRYKTAFLNYWQQVLDNKKEIEENQPGEGAAEEGAQTEDEQA